MNKTQQTWIQKAYQTFAYEGIESLKIERLSKEVGKNKSWFFLDSSGSIASGNVSNAFFNILVLLVAVEPLWVSAKQ